MTYVVTILIIVLSVVFAKALLGIVFVAEDKVGIVTKKFVLSGKNKTLPEGRIIATNGEPGYQADTLAPGLYFWYWPWQYTIEKHPFVLVPEGKICLIVANDGDSIPPSRLLGRMVECNNFQDARAFLLNKGEKGRQIGFLTAGSYRLNTALFKVEHFVDLVQIPLDSVGIVTTLDGEKPSNGQIAGAEVPGHDNFQNGQRFIDAGGTRGLQEQVLLPGAWSLNPWLISVELGHMIAIPIGHVGVVISYFGKDGDDASDASGKEFKHGNIYPRGYKGVWKDVLGPGKYAINTYLQKVELVPTTNISLSWANNISAAHGLDGRLSSINVRSKDGFTLTLDVTQIIHIPALDAPKVISAVGSLQGLISQVLEPTIGNYFRNAAQDSNAVDFISQRTARQKEGKDYISKILEEYDVQGVDTLIGDIVPPNQVMTVLADRKIAEMEKETFRMQQEAQEQREKLERAKANADIQLQVVQADQGVLIASKHAESAVKKAEGEAKSVELAGKAKAESDKMIGLAEAEIKRAKGLAEAEASKATGLAAAEVIEAQGRAKADAYTQGVKALGADYARIQVAETLSNNKMNIVPTIQAGGDGGLGNGLMGYLLLDKLEEKKKELEQKD